MDGLDTGMRELAAALSAIGEKVDRLTEVTLAVERMSSSTVAAVEVCHYALVVVLVYGIPWQFNVLFSVGRYHT